MFVNNKDVFTRGSFYAKISLIYLFSYLWHNRQVRREQINLWILTNKPLTLADQSERLTSIWAHLLVTYQNMEPVYLLWFLSISMLMGSFLSGIVPMTFRMSDNRSRLLALLGSGILVGTALSIIIPEGIDSLYGESTSFPASSVLHQPHTGKQEIEHDHIKIESDSTTRNGSSMTWIVGSSLIVGFVLMLLIDQLSLYQAGGGSHGHYPEVGRAYSPINYSLAPQEENEIDTASEEQDVLPADSARVSETMSRPNSEVETRHGYNGSSAKIEMNSHRRSNSAHDHSVFANREKGKVTPTLGLVIHAAADGIALGAAATTSHRQVELIIFLAIMLHKAPAAFSLVVLLLHKGLPHPTIRKHLLAFSLSAPVAAMITFFGLSQSGKEALRKNNATGIAMLFSAGTFLFVATVHVLPELIHNKLLTPKELLFLLSGTLLPLLLAQSI